MHDDLDAAPLRGLACAIAGLRELAAATLPPLAAPDLIAGVTELQRLRNLSDSLEQQLLAQIGRDHLHEPLGYPTVQAMLVGTVHIDRTEANARVQRAEHAGPRTSLLGGTLPPRHDLLAQAQAAGIVSGEHATTVIRAMRRLPASVPAEQLDEVEAALVELATRTEPAKVAVAGRRAQALFDPDGREPRDARIDRGRTLRLGQSDDGMGDIGGHLTPELLAALHAVLSPLAAPRPADANGPDPRTAGQRLHDALADAMDRLLRAGTLPESGGVATSVSVVITLDQLQQQVGEATTSHGTTIDVRRLLRRAGELEIIPVVLSQADGILAYGTVRRFATPGQTKAIRARDGGCSFPRCPRPPEWSQRHHVLEVVADNGPTDVDNLTIVCGYHHRTFHQYGWTVKMINGRPWWIPPATIDPQQRPMRNTLHDPPEFPTAV